MSAEPPTRLAYLWGEDAFGLERAAAELAAALAVAAGQPIETWRTNAEEDDRPEAGATDSAGRRRQRLLDQIEERLATMPLFGGGTFVVVRQPATLLRESSARQRLLGMLALVAGGNGLCFIDLVAAGGRAPAQGGVLRDAVAEAGGLVRELPALSRERMEAFIVGRARELGVGFAPGAARLLAERIGAFVREGDIDRRRQAELANSELEKLALYRPGGSISREDVAELVSEAVPGSAWALLDAVGARRGAEAATLAERLLGEGMPLPVLIAQLHRRLRELIVIADHLAAGTRPAELVRALKLQPFRAQKLAEQARGWRQAQLDEALSALLEIDLLSKGIAPDGSPRSLSEDRARLALAAWFAEHARRAA